MNRQIRQNEIAALRIDLHGAYIARTDLSGASLRFANLENIDGRGAVFAGADLSGANLKSANLSGADLREVNFKGAVLKNTDLRKANLTGAKNLTAEQLAEAITDATLGSPDTNDRGH